MFATQLECRQCGEAVPLGPRYHCESCFGPLEVRYDYTRIRRSVSRSHVAAGPPSIWRYSALLPVERRPVDLGTGWTPLLRADRLGRVLDLRNLWIKNDSVNPTFSFKDRNVAVAVNKALEFGFDTFACASTGNLAGSVAGFAARAGLKSYVFVPADLEANKLLSATVCGATLVTVDGNYDAVNRLCGQVADQYGWGFANINLRPFYSEGSKTVAFETVEQLGWEAPDAIVVPMAGASLLTKIHKGLQEMVTVGWLAEASTRLIGAQAEGCAPVVRAFRGGAEEVQPVVPRTIARSLAIGDPADGFYALRAIRASGGVAEDASDAEIVDGIRLLARTEGIFTETAGGTVIAAARRLREQGLLDRDERTVLCITGNGLKTPEVLDGSSFSTIHLTQASLGAFEARIEEREEVA
ncbi:MAG TPA: threonine synthase [Chloroflexota bacterium]|nr:threonine synthase [Chloroflexota bacterium]